MSDLDDLKTLTWTVQSTVSQPGFDTLTVRARRRRRRHRALTASATATAAVAVTGLLVNGFPQPNTGPATSGTPAPSTPAPAITSTASVTTDAPLPPLRTRREVVDAPGAGMDQLWMGPGGLAGVWTTCFDRGADCQTASATRDEQGRVTVGRVDHGFWMGGGDERYAVLLNQDDPDVATPRAIVMSATGRSEVVLRRLPDTTSVTDDEVLLTDETGPLAVDPGRRTLRRLVQADEHRLGPVVRDGTSAIWLPAGVYGADPGLLRSTDGGRSWQRTAAIGDPWGTQYAVSPDGRTIILADHDEAGAGGTGPSLLRVSHDSGRTWTTVALRTHPNGVAAFDDGTTVVNGAAASGRGHPRSVYRIDPQLKVDQPAGAPTSIEWLRSSGGVLYGFANGRVATSADHGAHWTILDLR